MNVVRVQRGAWEQDAGCVNQSQERGSETGGDSEGLGGLWSGCERGPCSPLLENSRADLSS